MDRLAEWAAAACAELGIDDAADVEPAMVLEAAREVARAATKPAAMVSAYLMGVAVGRGMRAADAAARITAMVGKRSGAVWDWRD
jgi:hypothetical protein